MSKKGFDDIPDDMYLSKQTQKSGKKLDYLQKEKWLSEQKCVICERGDHLNELEKKIMEDQTKSFEKDKAKQLETEMKIVDDEEDIFPCKLASNPSCYCRKTGPSSSRNNVTLSLKSSLGKLSIKSCSVYCLTKENDDEQLPCIQLKTDYGIRSCKVKRICCTDPSSEENNSDPNEVYKSMFFCIDLMCKPKESSATTFTKVISRSCQFSVAPKALCYTPTDSLSIVPKTEFTTSNVKGSQTQIEALADFLSKNTKYNFFCSAPKYSKGSSFLTSNGFYDILCQTSQKVNSRKIPLDVIVFEGGKKTHSNDTMNGKENERACQVNTYQYDNPYESSKATSCEEDSDVSFTEEDCTGSSATQIIQTMSERMAPLTCLFCQKACKSCCFKISESKAICCCCRFSLPTLAKESFAKQLASQNQAACFFQFSNPIPETSAPKTTKEPARLSPSTGKSNRNLTSENSSPSVSATASSAEQPEDNLFIFCTTMRKIIDNNKFRLFKDLNDQLSTCIHTTKSCNRSK